MLPSIQDGTKDVIRQFSGDRLPVLAEDLDVRLEISGPDVLNGVRDLAANASPVFVGSTLPAWMAKAANRGRNVIALKSTDSNR